MSGASGPLAPSPGRIKRQVQGRSHRFALVCPPGFEAVCLDEARALGLGLLPLAGQDQVCPGPVLEWEGRLPDLYRACRSLRVASRVLVRLAAFRAGAREELFRHCLDFPWELWLPAGAILRIDAHVRHSRISHEGMCARTVFEAMVRRMGLAGLAPPVLEGRPDSGDGSDPDDCEAPGGAGAPAGAPPVQRVIIHLADNHANLSLDASGAHLHRRGWRTVQGAAPIRENLAAGLLLWAGWPGAGSGPDGIRRLVDGMCGSGTFAIEATALAQGLPPGGGAPRDYAFRHWPSFLADTWNRLARPGGRDGQSGAAGSCWVLANELDPDTLALARANAAAWRGDGLGASPGAAEGMSSAAGDPSGPVRELPEWRNGDFFDLSPPGPGGLLVLNPPYGLRLSDGGGSLYPRLCRQLAGRWAGWSILLLGPPETALGPLGARLARSCRFRHGGLQVTAWLFSPGDRAQG